MRTDTVATSDPPSQFRPQDQLRVAIGDRDPEKYWSPNHGDCLRITKRRPGTVTVVYKSGKTREIIVYDVVPELQKDLVDYLQGRGIAGAAKPQEVPISLIWNRPEANLYGAQALFGAGGRRTCFCEEWREKTPEEYTAQGLPDAEAQRDEMGNLPRQYYIGEATWQEHDKQGRRVGEAKHHPCDCHTCPYIKDNSCKCQVVFAFRLRDFVKGGYPLASLHSTSMQNWMELLHWQRDIQNEMGGQLANVPLKIVRGERRTTTPEGQRIFVPYVTLEMDGSAQQLLAAVTAHAQQRLSVSKQLKQLASSLIEYGKEAPDFVDEFHPDVAATGEGKPVAVWEMELRDAAEQAGIAQAQVAALVEECSRTDTWEEAIARLGSGAAEVAEEAGVEGENEDVIDADFEAEDEAEAAPEPDEPEKPRDLFRPADEDMPDGETVRARMKDLMDTSAWTKEHIIGAVKGAGIKRGVLPKPEVLDDDKHVAWQVISALHRRGLEHELTEPFPAIFEANGTDGF